MAFGQASGPPAGSRLVNELLELLNEAGHSDFRDARGPMGFTQRQAGGKFTVEEAEAFIADLQDAQHRGEIAETPPPAARATKTAKAATRLTPQEQALRKVPDAQLAAELQRRGWIVVEP